MDISPAGAEADSALTVAVEKSSWRPGLQLGLLLLTGLVTGRAAVTLYFFGRFTWGEEAWELLWIVPLVQFQLLRLWMPPLRPSSGGGRETGVGRRRWILRVAAPLAVASGFLLGNRWLALAGFAILPFLSVAARNLGDRFEKRLALTLLLLVSVPVLLETLHGGRLGSGFGRVLLALLGGYAILMIPLPRRVLPVRSEPGSPASLPRSRIWMLLLAGYLWGAGCITWISFGRIDLRPGTTLQWLIIPLLQAILVGIIAWPFRGDSWSRLLRGWTLPWFVVNLLLALIWIRLPGAWGSAGSLQVLILGIWGAILAWRVSRLLPRDSSRKPLLRMASALSALGPALWWLDGPSWLASLGGIFPNRWLGRAVVVSVLLGGAGLMFGYLSRSLNGLLPELRDFFDVCVLSGLAACQLGWMRTYWGPAAPDWSLPLQGACWIVSLAVWTLALEALRRHARNRLAPEIQPPFFVT